MNTKRLGILGVLGAPFLLIGTAYAPDQMALASVLYMAGWMSSLAGLIRLRAAGESRTSRLLFGVLAGTLCLAQVWNGWSYIDPTSQSPAYRLLDLTWPLSNLLMLLLGILIGRARRLAGWGRYVPLAVGLWLPLALLLKGVLGRTDAVLYLTGGYSALAWALLGVVVWRGRVVVQRSEGWNGAIFRT